MKQDKVMARDLIKAYMDMPDGEFREKILRILPGFDKRIEDFREALDVKIK